LGPTESNEFAKRYAQAWCSQDPERVAAFFSKGGSLSVNDGSPAIGREAIAEVAAGFMTAFPDMTVTMDDVLPQSLGSEFHWTLAGTNNGPGGTGTRVRFSGYEGVADRC
jgi:SnoaL-like domain